MSWAAVLRKSLSPSDAPFDVLEQRLAVTVFRGEERESSDQKRDLRDDRKRQADHPEDQQQHPEHDLSGSPDVLRHRSATPADCTGGFHGSSIIAPAWNAPTAVRPCAPVIPIRDTIVSSTTPIVTYALIAANVGVYLHQESLGPGFERFIELYGLVPRRFVISWWSDVTPLFSSMFLHGGWLHLLGNMLY